MNKKYFLLASLVILIFSCKSYWVDYALDEVGVFDDKVELRKFKNDKRTLVLIPMHHIGTKLFYDDVKHKVDSLQKNNYTIYYELITADEKKDSTKRMLNKRKLRKILGSKLWISRGSHLSFIKEKLGKKVKLKKELINQPSYKDLGVDLKKAKNVDANLSELITYYEQKYGKIELEECDFANLPKEVYECEDPTRDENKIDEIILTLRNNKVINQLEKDSLDNIAIIYGKGHFKEIEKYLINNNYKIP